MLVSTAAAFSTILLYEHNVHSQIHPHVKFKMLIHFLTERRHCLIYPLMRKQHQIRK